MPAKLTFGLPRMHLEAGERRDFLPELVGALERLGAGVLIENGYGSGMGLKEADYHHLAPNVRFGSHRDAYAQDYILVLRCPVDEDLQRLRPGACLISMLHYPTRPERVTFLRSLGIEAISLDSLKDDSNRRLVENLRAVAWNGVEIAFQVLRRQYPAPGFESPQRPPIQVLLLGSGAVGIQVVQAAIRYGDSALWKQLAAQEVPGVQVTAVDYDTTPHEEIVRSLLEKADLVVDATQRPDPTKPAIHNHLLAALPQHAVLLDLSVDPYDCKLPVSFNKGIEGMPQGNLDQYVFEPNDPAFDAVPPCIDKTHRRTSVSCYSWPGIHPKECMQVYGAQLRPLLRKIIEKGGVQNIEPKGSFFERALARGQLSRWRSV